MKVIGIQQKTGTYEGRPYDNYVLYCTQDSSRDGVKVIAGTCPDVSLKVKASVLYESIPAEKVAALLGHDINCYYDQYKNVCKVILVS